MTIGSRRVRREFFITFPNMRGQSSLFLRTTPIGGLGSIAAPFLKKRREGIMKARCYLLRS